MLHDFSSLPASSALSTAVPWEVAVSKLPGTARHKVMWLEELMLRIHSAPRKRSAMRQIARQQEGKIAAESLKRHYYHWLSGGSGALIDHRRCGGCGVAGCNWARKTKLSAGVVQRWAGEAGTNDKQALTEAWRVLMRDLCDGKPVVDGLTWGTLFIEIFPGLEMPARCPWSVNRPPPGWSLENFMKLKPATAVLKALKKGASAAWNLTPEVRMDLSELRPFEALVFDDHKTDFLCMVWDERGKVQVVEMVGLFAMDVATGAVLEFGLRPAILRPDGTRMGVTLRDMQHLIAHILNRYGYPLDYKMTLIVENAAAAVSAETERLLHSRTNGQVVVSRTGVHFGAVNVRGFPERWGAPRGKAWLESWFNLLDISLGAVKGQTGSNWTVKPGHADGVKWLAERMAHVITARPHLAEKLNAPLHWAGEANWIVKAAIDSINNRTQHSLERHQLISEWRYSPADPTPKPILLLPSMDTDTKQMVKWFQSQTPEVQGLLINNHGQPRRESPLEKMVRTWNRDRFAVIPEDTFIDLMLDAAPAIYKGGDVLDIETGRRGQKKMLRYVATEGAERLALGQKVRVRFDSDRPGAGAWVMDEKEAFLGYYRFQRDPHMMGTDEDLAILHERMGAKSKAHTEIVKEASKLRLSTPTARAELQGREDNIALLETLPLPAPTTVARAAKASRTLATTVRNQSDSAPLRSKPTRGHRPPPRPVVVDTDDGFSFE